MLLKSCDSYARVGIKGGVVWCRLGWVFINMHQCISNFQVPIGVRTGGAKGAAAPPNFGQLRFFWAARENLGKTSFLRRFRVF